MAESGGETEASNQAAGMEPDACRIPAKDASRSAICICFSAHGCRCVCNTRPLEAQVRYLKGLAADDGTQQCKSQAAEAYVYPVRSNPVEIDTGGGYQRAESSIPSRGLFGADALARDDDKPPGDSAAGRCMLCRQPEDMTWLFYVLDCSEHA